MLKEKVKQFIKIGISLKSIALHSGVHYTTLSKWINDEREMNSSNQEKIENGLKDIVNEILNIFNS